MVATGFNILERTTHILNFAHGDLIMWAPMGTLVATNIWGISEWPAIAIGMAICIVMGLVIERFCMRPFLGRPAQYGWILTTLGASTVVEQFAAQPFSSQPQFFPYGVSRVPFHISSTLVSPQEILLVGSAVGAVIVLLVLYRTSGSAACSSLSERTPTGREPWESPPVGCLK